MTIHAASGDGAADLEPLGSEQEFAELVSELVADEAPRLFALVEECGDRVDAWIIAWGMELDGGRAEVVGVGCGLRGSFASAERARRAYARRRKIRLVRTSSVATRRPEDEVAQPSTVTTNPGVSATG